MWHLKIFHLRFKQGLNPDTFWLLLLVHTPLYRRIPMEKLSTTKLHNFSISTTFILVVSPSEVIYKIWISNLRNSNVVFDDKMISNKKNYQLQSFITFWDLQLSFWWFFQTRSLEKVKKFNFKLFLHADFLSNHL